MRCLDSVSLCLPAEVYEPIDLAVLRPVSPYFSLVLLAEFFRLCERHKPLLPIGTSTTLMELLGLAI
jgi:hypothetical protein